VCVCVCVCVCSSSSSSTGVENRLSAIYSYICTTVVVRSAVTGPDSSWVLSGQHTEVHYVL